MSKFQRPESLSFPHVYYTFKAKDKDSDSIVEYRVQDLPEEFYDSALELIVKHFLPEETFCMCKKISESTMSVKANRDFYRETFKNRLSIACFKNDGSDESLVAVNVLVVKSKKDEKNGSDDYDYVSAALLCLLSMTFYLTDNSKRRCRCFPSR